jgi:hypothetical protein
MSGRHGREIEAAGRKRNVCSQKVSRKNRQECGDDYMSTMVSPAEFRAGSLRQLESVIWDCPTTNNRSWRGVEGLKQTPGKFLGIGRGRRSDNNFKDADGRTAVLINGWFKHR